ncbi:hypothetical protein AYL99_01314 [Fonsecaea erecta]|uniref:BTB domain-containing protein n=1 Tax=Fonsecaea erecta TaxID=1367422 RepID=A0A179A024_9EURO|nr:hypothetical protein AYL99_01314 [Fonsecaea erecta]OAP65342.1 hypothetical protein AYL99_01314 [Fonsecaea erecta]
MFLAERFLVGLEHKAFNVHSTLVVQLSPVFAAMINGNMLESVERRAVLDDIDEATFVRFCEYAYKGDFSVPPPTTVVIDKERSSSPLRETIDHSKATPGYHDALSSVAQVGKAGGNSGERDGLAMFAEGPRLPPAMRDNHHDEKPSWKHRISRPVSWLKGHTVVRNSNAHTARDTQLNNNSLLLSKPPVPGSKLATDWAKFCSGDTAADWKGPVFQPYRNRTSSESLAETLLSQARLYVFADRYVVESLRLRVLYKMRRSLASLKLFPERVPEVFGLVQYVYENTREGDDLRLLLTHFAACKVTALLEHPDWEQFIGEQRTFTWDLLQHLRESVEVVEKARAGPAT